MPRVRFTDDFDWRDPRLMRRHEIFRVGEERLVTTPCAEAAIKAGKAIRIVREGPADKWP